MATGRIGVTPILRTRWSKLPTTGTTVLSGLDDNSVALVYDAGYEAVYRNGVLLSRGNDYTATNGTTVTLIDATLATDIIEIFANDLVPLTDAISKGQYNAKGALLSATAASTPAVLPVGSNAQVLTADSTASTGLAWATASSGGMTLLSTTTLTSSSQTISGISGSYIDLVVYLINYKSATDGQYISFRFNADATAGRTFRRAYNGSNGTSLLFDADTGVEFGGPMDNTVSSSFTRLYFPNYTNTTTYKWADFSTLGTDSTDTTKAFYQRGMGGYNQLDAISSLNFLSTAGNLSGTVLIYGVK